MWRDLTAAAKTATMHRNCVYVREFIIDGRQSLGYEPHGYDPQTVIKGPGPERLTRPCSEENLLWADEDDMAYVHSVESLYDLGQGYKVFPPGSVVPSSGVKGDIATKYLAEFEDLTRHIATEYFDKFLKEHPKVAA